MPDADLRRTAIQLAAQLPERKSDARRVVCLMSELVENYLLETPEERRGDLAVLEGRPEEGASRAVGGPPSAFARATVKPARDP